ncbi:MAG: hypothetical protein M5R41_00725 [Bacteroidia bacterium]|nr:hypothetical protein [Bacteroidia bacterium]
MMLAGSLRFTAAFLLCCRIGVAAPSVTFADSGEGGFRIEQYRDSHEIFLLRDLTRTHQHDAAPFAATTMLNGVRVFFSPQGLHFVRYTAAHATAADERVNRATEIFSGWMTHRVDLRLVGSAPASVETIGRADAHRWVYTHAAPYTDGNAWQGLRYRNVWPGIDLECLATQDGIKYQFIVHPGADARLVRLRMDGANGTSLLGDGTLRHDCGAWSISDAAPVAFVQGAEADRIPARWKRAGKDLRFDIGAVPTGKTLVIDPFLQWSTFMGGSLSDYARDVAVGADGSTYVCGYTASTDFPVSPGVMQSAFSGSFDLFITKFSRERRRVWTTFFGGSGAEENPQIALSPGGDIVVGGSTSSVDLPIGTGTAQQRNGGRYDVFVLALDADGRRKWVSYLGGSYTDELGGLAVDAQGRICLAGATYSTNFPVTPDAWQTSNAGDFDMFVARFTAGGALDWATYIGGWSMDIATDIAVNASGDMFISGRSESTNLPAVGDSFQPQYGGGTFDGLYYHIDGRLRRVIRGSYLGGEGEDCAERIAVRKDGSIVIAGYTESQRFPVKGNLSPKKGGAIDGFVAVLEGKGDLRWSAVFGGADLDRVGCLDVDANGNIFLAGVTASKDFPLAGIPDQKEKGMGFDAFVMRLGSNGAYLWGSFAGAEGHDIAHGIAADAKGNVVVVGGTESRGFKTAGNLFQADRKGLTDAFILRLIFDEPLASAGPDTTICAGSSVVLGGDIGGGLPPYRFLWEPSSGLNKSNEQRPTATPSHTTTYVLSVTDAEGAVTRDTAVVTVVALPVAKAGPPQAVCPGYSATLGGSASGGSPPYRFSWAPADGLQSPGTAVTTATPRRSTWYTLTVTDARGCTSSDSVLVTVHPPLTVDAGGDREACANTPSLLQAEARGGTPPFRYAWSPSAIMENPSARETRFTPRGNIAVSVLVTDANGCVTGDTIRIIAHQPPVVDAGDAVSLCAGEKTVLKPRSSGGKPPYSYRWSPAEGLSSPTIAAPQASPMVTTRYVLTVTDANGCSTADSLLVAVHPQPGLNMVADAISCTGVPVRIGAEAANGTPPYRYQWSPVTGLDNPSAAMPLASPSRSTTYAVTVTDANGCRTGGTVRVTVQPKPVLKVSGGVTLCRGASTQLTASVRGGTAPYTYLWKPEAGLSSATLPSPVAAPLLSTTYRVTVTDAAGCVVEEQISVAVADVPTVNAGKDVSLCSGAEVELNANVTGGRPPYRFVWSPATGLSSTRTLNPRVAVNRTTSYMLTVTDASGCTVSDSVTVFSTVAPRVQAGPDATICAGSIVQLTSAVTGGTPPFSWKWSPAFGLSNASIAAPTASPTSSTQYTVTVTDALGCTAADQVVVTVHPPPALSLPKELTICRGQSKRIELGVSGGSRPYRYEWVPREGLSDASAASPVANPVQTTTYSVTVTDAHGCKSTAMIVVIVQPCNKADAGMDQDMCVGAAVRLGTTSPDSSDKAQFTWTPVTGLDNPLSPAPMAAPLATTRYILQVGNSFGCVARDTVLVRVREVPRIQVTPDLTVCNGGSARLAVQVKGGKAPYRFTWSPQSGLSRTVEARTEARPVATTRYTVTVTDAEGCSSRDSVLVTVAPPLAMSHDRSVLLCEGEGITIGARVTGGTPPFNFFWSPPEGLDSRTVASPLASPRRSLKYTVTVTDASGCQLIDTVMVTVLKVPRVDITASGATDICEGRSVRLNAPVGFTRYRWSNGSEGPEILVGEPGEYFVSVWNEAGCEGRSAPIIVRVFQPPTPEITALGPLRFCEGDSVVLDAGAGFRSYRWIGGGSGRRLTARSAGEYRVTVAGPGDCEETSEAVRVQIDPAPVARISSQGDTLIASDAESFQWRRDGKVIAGATARWYIPTRAGNYTVLVTNERGCSVVSPAMRWRPGTKVGSPVRRNAGSRR